MSVYVLFCSVHTFFFIPGVAMFNLAGIVYGYSFQLLIYSILTCAICVTFWKLMFVKIRIIYKILIFILALTVQVGIMFFPKVIYLYNYCD